MPTFKTQEEKADAVAKAEAALEEVSEAEVVPEDAEKSAE